MEQRKLSFSCDYLRGAHPNILKRLADTNLDVHEGYGADQISFSAKEKIRSACHCPGAKIMFLTGGTQANSVVIDALLSSYQGVIAADSAHISTHEAGAIEASGHKVLTLPQTDGKLSARCVSDFLEKFYHDENHAHMVMPGMLYLSQPTECGTLYSRAELVSFHDICQTYNIPLYIDGARLAYALACPKNDVSLADLAALCDVFYIGGTKCGALFGEAVVLPDPDRIPHLFTIVKQHGALLAKGRILGIQFDELFTDHLYERIGIPAIQAADLLRHHLKQKGYRTVFSSPTNQIFCIMDNQTLEQLKQSVSFSFWEPYDENCSVIRFATDWTTSKEDVLKLSALL